MAPPGDTAEKAGRGRGVDGERKAHFGFTHLKRLRTTTAPDCSEASRGRLFFSWTLRLKDVADAQTRTA